MTEGISAGLKLVQGFVSQSRCISKPFQTKETAEPRLMWNCSVDAVNSCGRYLDAELIVCGRVVELPACDGAEDVAVLQVGQQLQVAGLLFQCKW